MLKEKLQDIYDTENIVVQKIGFCDSSVKSIIINNKVYVSDCIEEAYEDNVLKAHELAHYKTNPPNLFDADKITQKKYERLATRDTARMLCPLDALINLYFNYIRTVEDIAEALEVTPKYICSALKYYSQTYGNLYKYKNYRIQFIPLEINDETQKRRILPSKQGNRRQT